MNDTITAVREAVLDPIEASLAYQLNPVRAAQTQPHR